MLLAAPLPYRCGRYFAGRSLRTFLDLAAIFSRPCPELWWQPMRKPPITPRTADFRLSPTPCCNGVEWRKAGSRSRGTTSRLIPGKSEERRVVLAGDHER